jgi:hypothetical protein
MVCICIFLKIEGCKRVVLYSGKFDVFLNSAASKKVMPLIN